MAERVLILHDIRSDRATLSASSQVGSFTVANLQDRLLSKAWRAAGVSEQVIADAGAGVVETFNVVALWNHNLSVEATIRVRVSDNADLSAATHDETFFAWPSVWGWCDRGWCDDGWGGVPLGIEDALLAYKRYTVMRLSATVAGRYLGIDIDDPSSADGYIQAGRLLAGLGWQPAVNFSFGWQWDWIDPSEQTEMDGGAVWVDKRDKFRELYLPFKFASQADATGNINDLKRIVGNSGDVLVVPFPEASADQYITAIYGIPRPGGLAPERQDRLNRFDFSMRIRELTA